MGLSCGSSTFRSCLQATRKSKGAAARRKLAHRSGRNARKRWRSEIINGFLVHNFETILFDNWVGENFFGDAFQLLLGFIPVPAVKVQHEEFALANVGHLRISQAGQGVLNGLSLRIEHGAFWHYPNMSFHGVSITLPETCSLWTSAQARSPPRRSGPLRRSSRKRESEAVGDQLRQFCFTQAHFVRMLILRAKRRMEH